MLPWEDLDLLFLSSNKHGVSSESRKTGEDSSARTIPKHALKDIGRCETCGDTIEQNLGLDDDSSN